jgi:hypothetical protein
MSVAPFEQNTLHFTCHHTISSTYEQNQLQPRNRFIAHYAKIPKPNEIKSQTLQKGASGQPSHFVTPVTK